MINSILEVIMSYKEEIMLLDMVDSTLEDMKNIVKIYGNDSMQYNIKKAYLQAIIDVLDNLREN